MHEVTINVEAEVNPTEAEEKVEKAVVNVFGNIALQTRISRRGSLLTAELEGREALVKFRNLLRVDRVREAARKILFQSSGLNTVSFCLNKQVAFAGHISFSEAVAESPLGPLKVLIKCENPRELVDWLAPRST